MERLGEAFCTCHVEVLSSVLIKISTFLKEKARVEVVRQARMQLQQQPQRGQQGQQQAVARADLRESVQLPISVASGGCNHLLETGCYQETGQRRRCVRFTSASQLQSCNLHWGCALNEMSVPCQSPRHSILDMANKDSRYLFSGVLAEISSLIHLFVCWV